MIRTSCVLIVLYAATVVDAAKFGDTLRVLDVRVLDDQQDYSRMVSDDIERRRLLAIQRENTAWGNVTTRDEWERFRDVRTQKLRESLGSFPVPPKKLNLRVTRQIDGDGFRIENIVFESQPGLFVTGNLYRPTNVASSKKTPAILISHSHHNPKTQGELQDMGMAWARAGWVVLVPDHVGHGERRQHPFKESSDYDESFRVSRQDYYFRYNVNVQLQLVGESFDGLDGVGLDAFGRRPCAHWMKSTKIVSSSSAPWRAVAIPRA